MPDLSLKIIELIESNISEIKAKAEKEEISLKTCEEKTEKLEELKSEVQKQEWKRMSNAITE